MSAIACVLLLGQVPPPVDVYKDLAVGDRVQVVFRSGGTIIGLLVAPSSADRGSAAEGKPAPADPKEKIERIDYVKAPSVTLDLRWEFPGVQGTLTVEKREIRELQKLQPLDAAALQRLMEESQRARQRIEADDAARLADLEKRRKADEGVVRRSEAEDKAKAAAGDVAQVKKDAEKIAQGLELLSRFPPSEWSPEKLNEIVQLKTVRKQLLTPQEKEFQEGLPLWLAAKAYKEAKGEKPAGVAPPAPPPEEVKPTEEKKP